jgi:hypothetical protein
VSGGFGGWKGGPRVGTLTHPPRFARPPRTFDSPRHFPLLLPPPTPSFFARMASDTSRPEWTAPRVRETFLEYFKQNGHTFGEFQFYKTSPPPLLGFIEPPKKKFPLPPPKVYTMCPQSLTTQFLRSSPVVAGRSLVGPYSAFHQCWNESVQIYFPRYRGPVVRLCQVATRSEFSKGTMTPLWRSMRPKSAYADECDSIVYSCWW